MTATVQIEGDSVVVTGAGLDDRSCQFFFRGAISGERTANGWIVPSRRRDVDQVLLEIVQWLSRHGYEVAAADQAANAAMQRDIERVRSFTRAREAAAQYLGLGGSPASRMAPDEVAGRLADAGWLPERRLFDHQLDAVLHSLHAANSANFSVPGTGKTASALGTAVSHLAAGNIELVVVVGPLSSFRPWERETSAAMGDRIRVRRVRGGSRAQRGALYREPLPWTLLVMSYATAWSDEDELVSMMLRHNTMLIVDESHRVKRFRGGEWAPSLIRIARAARVRMILSGTPMPQGPNDLWSQFNVLWPGEEATGSRAQHEARGKNDFGALISGLQPFFVRTPKATLELLPIHVHHHNVEVPPIQDEIYRLIESRLRAVAADGSPDVVNRLRAARPIRLLQAASNPDLLNDHDSFFDIPPAVPFEGHVLTDRLEHYTSTGELPAKFTWTLDFLRSERDAGRKCVVWTSFVRNIDQLSRLVRDEIGVPVYSVDGRVPSAIVGESEEDELDDTREQRIDQFLDADGCAVLIANPAACAESISLHSACHTAVYVDRTYDCARWLQSIDRIHRLGLPPGVQVQVHVPMARPSGSASVDDLVDASLELKTSRMEALLEGSEIRAGEFAGTDSLAVSEGDESDLVALIRHLLGE